MTTTESGTPPAPVPQATQAGAVRARGAWTEPGVWTDRMLTALEQGVKGGVWYSLMDTVAAPRTLAAAWQHVRANAGAAGVDHDHQRGPNAFFDAHGLFNLTTAHVHARQSVAR